MELRDFVNSLGLANEGEYINNQYVIEYNNSDDFSDVYNLISLNKTLTCDDDSVATRDKSFFVFSNGEFEVIFRANFDTDKYKITVGER